jgi:hypothetical protein
VQIKLQTELIGDNIMEKLKFFTAGNLLDNKLIESYPWEYSPAEGALSDMRSLPKRKRIAKLTVPSTEWNVYSPIRGLAPNKRISKANPPVGLRGLVADYDMKSDIDTVTGYLNQMPESFLPSFVEVSLSEKIRLVWVFDREILVPSLEFCGDLIHTFFEKFGVPTLVAGYDKASEKPTQVWTNGGVWRPLTRGGEPVPPLSWDCCFGVICEVSKKSSLFGRSLIPLEDVAKEINIRWPGRWQGDFQLDALGIRFWDEKADNPKGCQVKPDGMLCFTGPVPFVKWESLLGKAWCDEKRIMNLGAAATDIIFDGRNYWELQDSHWVTTLRSDILVRLRGRRLSDRVEKGETQSECEKVFDYIQQKNRVEGAAPFINYPPGLIEVDGFRFLNNAYLRPVQAVPGPTAQPAVDFPFICTLLQGLFARPELKPLDYFLTWLKFGYHSILNYEKHVGQAVFLCGPINNGKTLLGDMIIAPLLGGRVANPMEYLTGNTQFNDELFACGLLAIHDEDAPRNEAERQKMTMRLKSFVVNSNHTYHPKFCSRLNIQWVGRVFVTLNDDPGSVGILPEATRTTQDKLMYFASQKHEGVWPSMADIAATIKKELPYFAHWLLNVYPPPEEVLDNNYRGGVKSYFDPVILDLSRQQMYSYNLEELIRSWIKFAPYWADGVQTEWTGSPTDLLTDIATADSLKGVAREWTQNKTAKALTSLAKQENGPVEFAAGAKREFRIVKRKFLE